LILATTTSSAEAVNGTQAIKAATSSNVRQIFTDEILSYARLAIA
jgi:hypothetical protein